MTNLRKTLKRFRGGYVSKSTKTIHHSTSSSRKNKKRTQSKTKSKYHSIKKTSNGTIE